MKKSRKKLAVCLISVFGVLIVLVSVALGVFYGTNVIQKGVIRMMCPDEPSSTPDNYEEILAKTTLKTVSLSESLVVDEIAPLELPSDALCVLVFHGGYYLGGGRHNQEPFARLIASRGFRVFNVDYALAPENIYPAQLRDANAALNYAAEAYPDAQGFVVTGDSAGAHLAAQLTALVKDESLRAKRNVGKTIPEEKLSGFVGSCGFYQASTVAETGFFLIGDAMEMLIGEKRYLESPVIDELNLLGYADSFPPSLLLCGDEDLFLSQNTAMFSALENAGVRVESYFPTSADNKLGHEFQCDYRISESKTATERIVGFLNSLI